MNIVLARLRTLLATISVKAGDVFEKDQVIQLMKLCKNGEVVNVCKADFNMSVVKEPVNSDTYSNTPMHDAFERFIDDSVPSDEFGVLTQKVLDIVRKKADEKEEHFWEKDGTWFYEMGKTAKNSGKTYKFLAKNLKLHETTERIMSLAVDADNVEDSKDKIIITFDGNWQVDWYAKVERQKEGENDGKYIATGETYPFIPLDKITQVTYSSNLDYRTTKKTNEKTKEGLLNAIDDAINTYANKFVENVDPKKALNGNALRGLGKKLAKQFADEFNQFCEQNAIDKTDVSDRAYKQFASMIVPKYIKPHVEEFIDDLKQLRNKVEKIKNIEDEEEVGQLNKVLNMFLNTKNEKGNYEGPQKADYGDFCKWLMGWGRQSTYKKLPISHEDFVKICNS
jgi:hypothetical protein